MADLDEQGVEKWIELLKNPDEQIHFGVFQDLANINPSFTLIFHRYLSSSQDKLQRLRIIQILGEIKETSSIPILISLFYDGDREIPKAASDALVKIGTATTPYLIPLLRSEDVKIRHRVLVMLRMIKDASTIPVLIDLFKENEALRTGIIFILGNFSDPAVIKLLHSLITSPDPDMRRTIAIELSKIGGLESISVLEPLLQDTSEIYFLGTVKEAAEYAIEQILERSKSQKEETKNDG